MWDLSKLRQKFKDLGLSAEQREARLFLADFLNYRPAGSERGYGATAHDRWAGRHYHGLDGEHMVEAEDGSKHVLKFRAGKFVQATPIEHAEGWTPPAEQLTAEDKLVGFLRENPDVDLLVKEKMDAAFTLGAEAAVKNAADNPRSVENNSQANG